MSCDQLLTLALEAQVKCNRTTDIIQYTDEEYERFLSSTPALPQMDYFHLPFLIVV
jgi:hypothetical protein